MVTGYTYELWDGKEVIGHFFSLHQIYGLYLVVPTVSTLKQSYYKKSEEIKVPILHRVIYDNGVDITIRKVLDVRKKSKRQIEILKQGNKY